MPSFCRENLNVTDWRRCWSNVGSSVTAAAEVVARRGGLGKETVRRWAIQAQIDGGHQVGT